MSDWPTDDHINQVALNGEVDAPTYEISGVLYRVNPAGRYALYWHKGIWRQSMTTTNERVLTEGVLK